MPVKAIPLPGPLRLTPSVPFVGRVQELAVLERLLAECSSEGRRVAVVQGEPGSGKTRLARQAAERAAGAGAAVLYGACDPSLAIPYQAFVEALEQLTEQCPSLVAEVVTGPQGAELGALLPGVSSLPPTAHDVGHDRGGGRYRLHAAVTEVLAARAADGPVVLVLDDLHWADAGTLLLLRHIARAAAALPLLVLATAREVEAETAPDLADALAELHRLDGVVRLRLGALGETEIGEFLRRLEPRADEERLASLVEALGDLTGGNAFLLAELAQQLGDAGMLAGGGNVDAAALERVGVPQGVRDVVGQRLARMAPEARDVVELAAVGPRSVELSVLRTAATLDDADLLRALDEATSSRMLEEMPGPRIRHRFRHELLRRAVADRIPATRRAALHLRVARALEAVHGAEDDRIISDLAFHFAEAALLEGRDRAVHYGVRAAELATRAFAHEEAARRLRAALELGIDDAATRAHVLCELGMALHRSGSAPQALESYAAAADVARGIGDAALLARAAIGLENASWRPGIHDARTVDLLEAAAAAAGDGEGPLHVRLLASLSRARAYRGEHAAAAGTWRRAVEMARRVDDPSALAVTLFHAAWTRGSQSPAAVLASLDEARDLFGALGEDDLRHEVDGFRLSLLLEAFEITALRRELNTFRSEVELAGQPFYLHVHAYMSSTLAICDGRLDDAEAMAARALELSRQFDEDASAIHGIQMFGLRRLQGRLAEVAPVVRLIAQRDPGERGVWAPALALLLAEIGMLEEAGGELRRLCADDFALVPRGGLWLGGLAYLADTCALVDDRQMAERVYAELSELAGKNVVIGQGVACYGAADRFLGTLAATMGDSGAAERHFEAALEHNARLASPTWLAHTRYAYARALQRRGSAADVARADEMLADALRTAREIGLAALVARAERAGGSSAAGAPPDGLSAREVQVLRLITAGLTNREIGDMLHISRHTAANHVRSILMKTGCANRTEAASYAHDHRLMER